MRVRPLLTDEIEPEAVVLPPLTEVEAPASQAVHQPESRAKVDLAGSGDEPPLDYYDGGEGADNAPDGPFIDLRYARDDLPDEPTAAKVEVSELPSLDEARQHIAPAVQLALKEYLKGEFREVKKYRPTPGVERYVRDTDDAVEELEDASTED
ncbi:MAG: hypothetical protein Q7P63_12855 [Verrucomicrobiota bacterium JB022]|nr:hypothetical protein [Verrucomicrobiota bacterium JB022]